jgi:hypothetical protein
MTSSKLPTIKEIFMAYVRTHANYDEELGCCDWVVVSDLVEHDPRFVLGNGGSWCRDDGPLRGYRIERKKNGNRIFSVRLTGKREDQKERRIREDIRRKVSKGRCVVLDVGTNIEVDHKNGRYDSHRMAEPEQQNEEDFQALSKAANVAKRQHCKHCKESGKRFDARRLGYSVGWLVPGAEDFNRWGCGGCYWHDPKFFNTRVSRNEVSQN